MHAGIDIQPHQREKLERLCRYVSRPPVAMERLALTVSGQVRYALKTPYRDGTTLAISVAARVRRPCAPLGQQGPVSYHFLNVCPALPEDSSFTQKAPENRPFPKNSSETVV